MTIPFRYAARRKTAIKGMAIRAMFFGCRGSGEKNGILDDNVETCFNIIAPFVGWLILPQALPERKNARAKRAGISQSF